MRLTTIVPLYLLTASVAAVWAAPTGTEPGKVVILDDNGDPITDGVKDPRWKFGKRISHIITTGKGDQTIKLPANILGNDLMVPKKFPKSIWDEKIYFRYTGGSACPPSWPCFGWSAMIPRTLEYNFTIGELLKREEDGHYSVIRASFSAITQETEELKQLAKEWQKH